MPNNNFDDMHYYHNYNNISETYAIYSQEGFTCTYSLGAIS